MKSYVSFGNFWRAIMICLGYFSAASPSVDDVELRSIVAHAQRKNTTRGVTGMLCHHQGCFMQFLEGEEPAVSEIYAAICRDPRHSGILKVYWEPISERIFGDWTMAAVNANGVGPEQKAFYRNLRRVELAGDTIHHQALTSALDSFRALMR